MYLRAMLGKTVNLLLKEDGLLLLGWKGAKQQPGQSDPPGRGRALPKFREK